MVLIALVAGRCLQFTFYFIRDRFSRNPIYRIVVGKEVDFSKVCTKIMRSLFTFKEHSVHVVCVGQRMALFGVLPMAPLVILPMVPLAGTNGTIGRANGTICITIGTNGITNGTIGRTLNDIGISLVPLVEY